MIVLIIIPLCFITGSHESLSLLKFYLFIFRERGRKRKRKGEKHLLIASCTSPTQACAWTGNRTCDVLVCRTMPSPRIPTRQGHESFEYRIFLAPEVKWSRFYAFINLSKSCHIVFYMLEHE